MTDRSNRWWGLWSALALAALTIALRVWHLDHGLPWFEEEALPFRKSFELWGWDGAGHHFNPGYFNYPSFTLYLQHMLQAAHYLVGKMTGAFASPADYWLAFTADPTPHVILARVPGVLADTASVLAVLWLGERWRRGVGLAAGLVVALAPSMVFHGRSIFTDTVMTAFVLWSLVMTVRWHASGARRTLIVAAVLAGLAAGAKYPGALALIPLAAIVVLRDGPRRALRTVPVLSALAGLVFLSTTPYALLDARTFWNDLGFERGHMAAGHLGRTSGPAVFELARILARNLGWPLFAAGLAGLGWALAGLRGLRDGTAADRVAVTAIALPYLVMFGSFSMLGDRYAVVIIPPLALLGCALIASLIDRFAGVRRRVALAVVLAAVVAWPAVGGLRMASSGGLTTRQQAGDWLAEHAGPEVLILQEEYGPNLLTFQHRNRPAGKAVFKDASEERRREFLDRRYHRATTLPMLVSGSIEFGLVDRAGNKQLVELWPDAWDFNTVFYDPRYFLAPDFVVLSSAMGDRYRADRAMYPAQNAVYDRLTREAEVAAEFAPSGAVSGPVITVYDLRGVDHPDPDFGPLTWLDPLPEIGRRNLVAALSPDGSPPSAELLCGALREVFILYFRSFYLQTGYYLAELGHHGAAVPYLQAVLAFEPEHGLAGTLATSSLASLGRTEEALGTVEACLEARAGRDDRVTRRLREMQMRLRGEVR